MASRSGLVRVAGENRTASARRRQFVAVVGCDRMRTRTARRFRPFQITDHSGPRRQGRWDSNPDFRGWSPACSQLHHVPMDTPGWTRTSGLCRRRTALCPLSYGRVKSLRQESNPHLGRTKGACLPLTLRRREVETAGLEPASSRCKRGALPVELRPQGVRTDGFEPPQPEATGLQPVELTNARRPQEGWPTGFEPAPRGSRPRDAPVTPQPPRRGRPDSNR
jgi:hypothetical protein